MERRTIIGILDGSLRRHTIKFVLFRRELPRYLRNSISFSFFGGS